MLQVAFSYVYLVWAEHGEQEASMWRGDAPSGRARMACLSLPGLARVESALAEGEHWDFAAQR